MFKQTALAFIALVSMSATTKAAMAQERTIVTRAPTADEYVDMLFAPEAPQIKTRGIRMSSAAPVTGASTTTLAAQSANQISPSQAQGQQTPNQPRVVAAPVNFALNSSRVPAEFHPYLINLAKALQSPEAEGKRILITGHTDSQGSDGYNLTLSHHRARAVVDFLAAHNVDRSRISAQGRGEYELIAGQESNHALNRRVEFSVF